MGIEDLIPENCERRVKFSEKASECVRPYNCPHYIKDLTENRYYCIPYTDKDIVNLIKYRNTNYERKNM